MAKGVAVVAFDDLPCRSKMLAKRLAFACALGRGEDAEAA
jgi:hypothetical protein